VWHHQILSDTGSKVSCDERGLCKEDLGDFRDQKLYEERREPLTSEEKTLLLSVEKWNLH